MWSGPRNISTAMMRAFGNRSDCYVCDEPLYAYYLIQTGQPHPGREQTIAHHPNRWQSAVDWLTGEIPTGKSIWYQKHMAHHLLPEIDRGWLDVMNNCFLIRDPLEMLTSLIEFLPRPTVMDTGLPQQLEIFQQVRRRTGNIPPIIDGRDVLNDPRGMLTKLCSAIGVPFDEAMLRWPPGRRETDGAWAPYWYQKVEQTTCFGVYRPKPTKLPTGLEPLYRECLKMYRELERFKIQP